MCCHSSSSILLNITIKRKVLIYVSVQFKGQSDEMKITFIVITRSSFIYIFLLASTLKFMEVEQTCYNMAR